MIEAIKYTSDRKVGGKGNGHTTRALTKRNDRIQDRIRKKKIQKGRQNWT